MSLHLNFSAPLLHLFIVLLIPFQQGLPLMSSLSVFNPRPYFEIQLDSPFQALFFSIQLTTFVFKI